MDDLHIYFLAGELMSVVADLLHKSGIEVNGSRPFDPQIYDERLYNRVLAQGSLGLGEAYMDGWWDCEDLSQFFYLVCRTKLDEQVTPLNFLLLALKARIMNCQSKSRSSQVGQAHYDIGNDLYQSMLDRRMVYTCGYWKNAKNLEEAQEAKLDLVCQKMGLRPGMKVLDIGCGWGGFLKFAAENYGVCGTGVTISKEQAELARHLCQGNDVDIRLCDYREVSDTFDRVISLGMFEHVGYKNYSTYMKTVASCLKDDGLFLLHTIGGNKSAHTTDPWLDKYIFPNGMIPSITQVGKAIEGYFVMEDWHNFGADYDKTLLSWFENFDHNWQDLQHKFDPVFYRRWKYYLLSCAGSFRSRTNQLWQIVLSKSGVEAGYASLR